MVLSVSLAAPAARSEAQQSSLYITKGQSRAEAASVDEMISSDFSCPVGVAIVLIKYCFLTIDTTAKLTLLA